MAHRVLYSRFFLERVFSWKLNLQNMVFHAVDHVAQDPYLHDYIRPGLAPYRQKIPAANGQYKLFFEVLASINAVYFSWVNDDTCLHDTRANFPDPCKKEFDRLRLLNKLEIFDSQIHTFQFEVKPNAMKPVCCRSKYLNGEVLLNSNINATTNIHSAHSFYCSESHQEIARKHTMYFLRDLHAYIIANSIRFEIRIYRQGHNEEIALLDSVYDRIQWRNEPDLDYYILAKR